MDHDYDVLIIGGGVVGAAIARELSHYRIRLALLEKEVDVSFGTSKSNSGIVHAGFHSRPGTLHAKLCVEGNRMFDRLSEELEFPFERRGSLMVAFTEEELQTVAMYYDYGRKNNVPYIEILSREKTVEMEPNLNPDVLGSLYTPSAGVVCPYEFCYALVEDALQNGLALFTREKAVRIAPGAAGAGRPLEVGTERGARFAASFVINAAGIYADDVAAMAGVGDFKITPRKGEEYLLDRRVSNLVRRVIYPTPTPTSKGLLVIPTVDGPVMVGPTAVDQESKTDLDTTAEGLRTIFEHAQKMVPSIRATDIITSFAGLRPVATGDDFIIGPTKVKGFMNAAGIQSPGLTSAPAIAEMMRDLLLKEGLKLEMKPDFIARRKGIPHIRKAVEDRDFGKLEEAIRANPDYAKLVCRCENVTEGEIIEAVRRGHTCMDSIKFMTRAGTGRCQGGFCSSRVMKIIEKETGTPLEKITKRGPGSEILLLPFIKGRYRSGLFFEKPDHPGPTCPPRGMVPEMKMNVDALIIGAGPAGLGAALSLKANGIDDILIVDREDTPGGILQQCIHNGFGLRRFKEELTGPEYAERDIRLVTEKNIPVLLRACALDIIREKDRIAVMLLSEEKGLIRAEAKTVILAMGCRERNRGNIAIPGSRPAGILTAGFAQKMMNMFGHPPGREIVILGSGDIGLIMARRLTWEGSRVKAVVEAQPYPGGLNRNIVQCLHDFDIPLYISHTISRISGAGRISSVEVAPLDHGIPLGPEKRFTIDCDTLLLSVGLVPENELSLKAGVVLDPVTRGAVVDADLMTSVPGIFACGNVLQVHDLADNVSEEAECCGASAARYLRGELTKAREVPLRAGNLVRYVLPARAGAGKEVTISFRPLSPARNVVLTVKTDTEELLRKKERKIFPSIMHRIHIPKVPENTAYLEVSFASEAG